MTTGKIDPRYGNTSATAPPWDDIERLLTDAQLYWIITVRTDGRPHAVPLVGVWHDGAFAFCTEHAGEVCGELLEGGGWVPGEAFDSPVVQSLYPALCAASALPDEPRDL